MAFTTLPTLRAGDILTGDHITTIFTAITEQRPIAVRKSANETVNNSATLQADDELFAAAAASRTYQVEAHLFYFSGATPDLKIQWTAPAGATLVWGGVYLDAALAMTTNGNFSLATVLAIGGTGGDAHASAYGTLVTSTTAGNLALTWAQNTANASNTIIYAGSELVLTLLA